jgi:oligopeptide transport system permease protein
MFKHIFPNGLGTIVTSVALVIPAMIYSETSLSYLGIINLEAGNTTSVGTLIAAGQRSITANAGYVAFFPCMFLVLLMLSFNLFGNGLRDAFNPSLRGSED